MLGELTASSMDLQTIRQDKVYEYGCQYLEIIAFFTANRSIEQSRLYDAHLAHLQGSAAPTVCL